ncbi:hypothetical protein KIH39_20800 [Telmatocola sphagniphila]|uniref:Uncharacterized protein n=1 Tax=Telmatocola sphagniphila TaxID=1123043 RepID=A0A8E6B3X9_9BACT|nr:hypothetical protein [Telmatocola sphagniphila]QVL31261.1 hypothetical protein KIH39_20800 [Telmatocola sphagniphila]
MSNTQTQFIRLVDDLIENVKTWAEPVGWTTKLYPKRMRASDRSIFEISALYLQKGPTRVLLDPVAYDVPGADAAVDLYLMPTYEDLASLYFRENQWMIHYSFSDDTLAESFNEPDTLSLDEKSLVRVLDSIAAHATPSV